MMWNVILLNVHRLRRAEAIFKMCFSEVHVITAYGFFLMHHFKVIFWLHLVGKIYFILKPDLKNLGFSKMMQTSIKSSMSIHIYLPDLVNNTILTFKNSVTHTVYLLYVTSCRYITSCWTTWITKDNKVILNERKRAFRDGNHDEVRRVQGALKLNIREAKDNYRRKLENKLK